MVDLSCGALRDTLIFGPAATLSAAIISGTTMVPLSTDQPEFWPPLPLESWKETYATLHLWTQMVGKVRLKLTPLVNHWWNVPLYVTARGLTTLPIRYRQRSFQLSFDFNQHRLQLETSDGLVKTLPLVSRSVAEFYQEFMDMLWSADIAVRIWKMPVEIPNPIPFDQDCLHATYDPENAQRFWQILLTVYDVFGEFRSRFIGKCSPVHFFWGSFDLAVTRFSGRTAPERPGADMVRREAYSHEVSSVGFWPGGAIFQARPFIPTLLRNPQASGRQRSGRMRRFMTPSSESSCSCTTTCAKAKRQPPRSWIFARARTPPQRPTAAGTARPWRGRLGRPQDGLDGEMSWLRNAHISNRSGLRLQTSMSAKTV